MDLKYYDNGEWISLKTVCGVEGVEDTPVDDDSTFATPKYITSEIITKDENNFDKYHDGTILNEKIKLNNNNVEEKTFVSKIELLDDKNGTITLKPLYNKIQTENEGNFVSNVSFDDDNNLKITKADISKDILSPISSGPEPPNKDTRGFFYLQTEGSNNSELSA
jgi:hypothetical protein